MPLDKTPTEVTNLVTCGRRCANFKRLLNQTTVGGLVPGSPRCLPRSPLRSNLGYSQYRVSDSWRTAWRELCPIKTTRNPHIPVTDDTKARGPINARCRELCLAHDPMMSGLAFENLVHRGSGAILRASLTRNQLLGRARLESIVQLSGVSADRRRPSALAISVSPRATWASPIASKCSSQLVDQHRPEPSANRCPVADWATIAATPRKSRTAASARHGITRPALRRSSQRVCAIRQWPGAVPFEASRPGGKDSGGFSGRPPPRGEVRHRDCPASFSTALSMPPTARCQSPGSPRTASLPGGNRLGGAPFDNCRLAIPR